MRKRRHSFPDCGCRANCRSPDLKKKGPGKKPRRGPKESIHHHKTPPQMQSPNIEAGNHLKHRQEPQRMVVGGKKKANVALSEHGGKFACVKTRTLTPKKSPKPAGPGARKKTSASPLTKRQNPQRPRPRKAPCCPRRNQKAATEKSFQRSKTNTVAQPKVNGPDSYQGGG